MTYMNMHATTTQGHTRLPSLDPISNLNIYYYHMSLYDSNYESRR